MNRNLSIIVAALFTTTGCNLSADEKSDGNAYMKHVAVYEWSLKSSMSPKEVMSHYAFQLTFRGEQSCITLKMKSKDTLGGEPSYCFDSESMLLKEKIDDVE